MRVLFLFFILIHGVSYAQEKINKHQKYQLEIEEQINKNYHFDDSLKARKKEILKEVKVLSKKQSSILNTSKAEIKPMDLPQATSVIDNTVLKNQQASSLTDVLKNANGVYIMGNTGGYQEEIAARGFSLSSSNTFKNGIRYFSGMPYETSGLEKVEFLKGSASILYGNVSAGGILNLVTKKPVWKTGGELGFKYGSFNMIKPTFDFYTPLSKNIAFRLNGSYEKSNSFRNYVHSERHYVNPSIMIKLNEKTDLIIEADYLNDNRTPDFGAGIIDYKLVDLPRNQFVGVSWGYFKSQQAMGMATLTHRISKNFNLNFINGVRFYQTDLFSTTRPNSSNNFVKPNGDWNRDLQRTEVKDNYFIQQLDLKGCFNTKNIKHQFLAGMDTEFFKTYTKTYKNYSAINKKMFDSINIFEPYNIEKEAPMPILDLNSLTAVPINRFGAYIQDLMSFTKKWKLLTGVRYSYQDTKSVVNNNASVTNHDWAFSPKMSILFQPTNNQTLFSSYSNSFQLNTGFDENKNTLKPSIINQYEIGSKSKLFKEILFFNFTAYYIDYNNFYQQSLVNGNTNANLKVATGGIKSNGVEIDIVANPIKGLSVLAGYSFNQTQYKDDSYFIKGSYLTYNPKNTANFSVNYIFSDKTFKGLNIGLINSYIGSRYAGRPVRVQSLSDGRQLTYIEGYFQMDATLHYNYKNWHLNAKLNNVFNALSYNVHDDNSVNPIAPQNYSIGLNYIF